MNVAKEQEHHRQKVKSLTYNDFTFEFTHKHTHLQQKRFI